MTSNYCYDFYATDGQSLQQHSRVQSNRGLGVYVSTISVLNNYPAKSRGILPDTLLTSPYLFCEPRASFCEPPHFFLFHFLSFYILKPSRKSLGTESSEKIY